MPYINIPDSKLTGAIAKIVGKIEGDVSGKVIAKANEIQTKFRTEGCPTDVDRIANQVNGLSNASQSINNRLSRFKSLPGKLKPPLNGLKAAIKIILTIPIPQSVPPGFGIPVNITTKFADILNLLKEFVKQIGDDVQALEFILQTSDSQLSSVNNLLSRVNVSVKACQVEKALRDKIDSGDLSKDQLKAAGLLNDDEIFIFSTLGPRLMDVQSGRSINDLSNETGLTNQEVAQRLKDQISSKDSQDGIGGGGDGQVGVGVGRVDDATLFGNNPAAATQSLIDALSRLEGSGIPANTLNELRKLLDSFKGTEKANRAVNSKFFHTGPDGTIYELQIELDPNSPKIAPRRFATATNPEGVVVFKGVKSFSSSTDILLDELKFRIDNQLS